MKDVDELIIHRHNDNIGEEDDEGNNEDQLTLSSSLWEPSGSWWKDFLYFSGDFYYFAFRNVSI